MKTVELTDQADTERSLVFTCPGCGHPHAVRVSCTVPGRPLWGWNGDRERPTFTPSLLVRYDFTDGRPHVVCHSFVTDGRVRFLSDCTHAHAGETLDLPECDW